MTEKRKASSEDEVFYLNRQNVGRRNEGACRLPMADDQFTKSKCSLCVVSIQCNASYKLYKTITRDGWKENI